MVAYFGLRIRIATAALPILGVGAFLWLIARGRTRSFGAVLAGFGLIFTGIDYLQTGMAGISWDLEALAGLLLGGLVFFLLVEGEKLVLRLWRSARHEEEARR
jgi:phosphate:Na+ symporter